MSSVSSWVLSVAGICFLTVLFDLFMPDGRMSPYVKKGLSYIIILVVVLPLPNLFKTNLSIQDIFSEININIQEDYIYNLNQVKLNTLEKSIENELTDKGIVGADVSISANIFDNNMQIDAVYVDLYNVVISNIKPNINIKTEVVSVVLSYVDIAKEKVIIYEWKNKEFLG